MLRWYKGSSDAETVYTEICQLFKRANMIYMRGHEASFLTRICSYEILDIEYNVRFPSFRRMPSMRERCHAHSYRKHTAVCTLNNAL